MWTEFLDDVRAGEALFLHPQAGDDEIDHVPSVIAGVAFDADTQIPDPIHEFESILPRWYLTGSGCGIQ